MTTGVLLMTYGAPRDDADLPRYLAAVRGGREPAPELVGEMRRRYALIGGSPLVRITRAQAAAVEAELGVRFVVLAGMRFSAPTIAESVAGLVSRGASRVVGVVMSPQWSPNLMGGYDVELRAAAASHGIPLAIAGPWYREPLFIAVLAGRVRQGLRDVPDAMVLLTAHSLPERVFTAEPEYIAQLRATAELVAHAAGLAPGRWRWAYQSAGHTKEKWLRPDLVELFPSLAASGARDVLVVPVQFVADHLEVLYDLDIAAAEQAQTAGLRYRRVAMPNSDPVFVRALAAIARATDGLVPGPGARSAQSVRSF